jgi:riboflavin transporter FmnP
MKDEMHVDISERPQKSNALKAILVIARVALLTALSFILYMFAKFPLPFLFPSFLDIQISELPALLGGFAMGPWAGIVIIVLKCLLKMPFTKTAFVGELADMLIGISFVLPATLIYSFKKSKKSALIGLAVGVILSTFMAVLLNRVILVPLYVEMFFKSNWQTLINMVKVLYPNITQQSFYSYYLWLGVLPFNLLRGGISGAFTFAVYKPVRRLLH